MSNSSEEECSLGGRDSYTPFLICAQLLISIVAVAGNAVVVYLIK